MPDANDLPPQWRIAIDTLRMSAEQLILRLAALEQVGIISDEATKAYEQWVKRLSDSLDRLPKE